MGVARAAARSAAESGTLTVTLYMGLIIDESSRFLAALSGAENRKSASSARRSARGPLVEGRDAAGVERGARTPRRREAPSSHMVKFIQKVCCLVIVDAVSDDFIGTTYARPDGKLLRFDARCAKGRAGISGGTLREPWRRWEGCGDGATAQSAALYS